MYIRFIKQLACIVSIPCFFYSCNDYSSSNRLDTYLGGEIVNPNSNFIILSKDTKPADTIYLDRNNRFLHKFEDFEDGIYSFRHSPENQLVLLEKGDSLYFRLNTMELDESLAFTGIGAEKNTFLIEMFLLNELERDALIQRDFKLKPQAFQSKQNALINRRKKRLNKLNSKVTLSPLAKKILKASYQYDFYSRFEMYSYSHYGITDIAKIKELPPSFFDYREKINFNNEDLKRLYSYNRFLNHYITNASYTNYTKGKSYRTDPVGVTMYELNLVDSLINNSYIKNNLLRGITSEFLLSNEDTTASKKVLDHYIDKSSNKTFIDDLTRLRKATAKLKPNNTIPNQELISSKGNIIQLSSVFKKPITALFFWSLEDQKHYVSAHQRAHQLTNRYPAIDFIAINTDEQQTRNWLQTINRHAYNPAFEYEFKYPKCSSEELVIYDKNKVILVNQQGKIINATNDLFSHSFEKRLHIYNNSIRTIH
ncbi:hypothetical protein ACE939_07520 [Aquimarina sp. W85]|uniref:hypothetical protein n=1 Tax=Aquimarina rhodophyticola TaxID=3342246 RepID=UPI0036717634